MLILILVIGLTLAASSARAQVPGVIIYPAQLAEGEIVLVEANQPVSVGVYWDGKYNGTELPTGDYWYVVRPNSTALNKEYVGHFTLYR